MIMGSAEHIASTYLMGHEAYTNKEKPLDQAEVKCTFKGDVGREPLPHPFTNNYQYYADDKCVNAYAKCVACLSECDERHPWKDGKLPCGCKEPTIGHKPGEFDCAIETDYYNNNKDKYDNIDWKKHQYGNTCSKCPCSG